MDKKSHPFCSYFELIPNPNNKSNKYAICFYYIEEYTQNIAVTKKECHVTNKIKFCHDHLTNCKNFKKWYNERKYVEILTLGNDDNNKVKERTGKRKGKYIIIL